MPQSNQPRNSNTNTMLIDATHPEETRVVVLKNGRVEEFDYESAARKLLRGNIYLAKVTRVEPSLQAAFVDYGGNRHGFLAFNEIHPDYYQIPIADRRALIEAEAAAEAEEEAEAERAVQAASRRHRRGPQQRRPDDEERALDVTHLLPPEPAAGSEQPYAAVGEPGAPQPATDFAPESEERQQPRILREDIAASEPRIGSDPVDTGDATTEPRDEAPTSATAVASHEAAAPAGETDRPADVPHPIGLVEDVGVSEVVEIENGNGGEAEQVETVVSEDALEELPSRPRRRLRSYKIQEVIKRRQVILVQVVKEERGTKGAALTTYLSLAGRYTVLMPNTARGGGISRKITNAQDRKRLKAIAEELEVEEGMGLIIRTAGATRTKQEIKRDYEYLLRLWESVRDVTLASVAPALVYEEGNLIKRSIRDLYGKDVEEVVVAGGPAFAEAQDFMRMLMPSHAKNVIEYKGAEPLFTRYQIERQLNAMFSPYVHLRSGGYLVINQTEALVAIDINSGKSTREFSIEETALNTNLEASDEIARQLKLRDLAGLIVIDFIDMEEKRNNRAVERRLKDALRFDRARIQVGRISHFGLMEMSRQRLRTGVLEGSTSQCPHCQGTGIIRSTESVALAVLRGLEDALLTGHPTSLVATTTSTVALYILNQKRSFITDMESRCGITVHIVGSDKMQGANFSIERMARREEPQRRQERAAVSMDWGFEDEAQADAVEMYPDSEAEAEGEDEAAHGERDRDGESGGGEGRRRRRRRRGRGRREEGGMQAGERGPRHEHGARESNENGYSNGHDGEHAEPRESGYAEGGPEDVAEFEPGAETAAGEHDIDTASDDRMEAREGGSAEGQGEGRGRRGRRRGRRGGRRGQERGDRPAREGSEQIEAGSEDGNGPALADEIAHGAGDRDQPVVPAGGSETGWFARTGSAHEPSQSEPSAHRDTAASWQPAVPVSEPAMPPEQEVVKPAPQPPQPVLAAAEPEPEAEPEPVAAKPAEPMPNPRRQPVASEPVLARVVVGADAGETQPEEPRPARRGWWRR